MSPHPVTVPCRELEAAEEDTKQKLVQAEEALEKAKKNADGGEGAIWWINKELKEAKKYMAQRR